MSILQLTDTDDDDDKEMETETEDLQRTWVETTERKTRRKRTIRRRKRSDDYRVHMTKFVVTLTLTKCISIKFLKNRKICITTLL